MRVASPDPQNDIDLSTLPSVLRRRAGTLALIAVAVGALTYGALLMVPSRYYAETQVRIGASLAESGRSGGSSESAALLLDKEAIASRVQELRSPDLARQLAAELKLNLRPEFNSAIDTQGLLAKVMGLLGLAGPRQGETEEERVLAGYYRALQAYQVKETRVITLGFTTRDGELSATAANRLVELYQDWLRKQGVTETTDTSAWLLPEIEKRARELAAAEAEVERYRSSANLFRGGGNQPSGLAEQQLSDLATELSRVRAHRSEAEARAQAARELVSRNNPDAIPDVQKSPVIQGLIAQRVRAERDMAEAATQLLPAHPRMKQLNAHVLDIRRQVQREAATIVEGLERESKALALREEFQSRALEDAKQRLGSKANERVRLGVLEDEAKAKRRELDGLRERYEASRSRGSTKAVPVEVQVIATASPSSRPSWPNRPQISALASAASFVLGLVLVLGRELLAGGRQPATAQPSPQRRAEDAHVSGAVASAPTAAAIKPLPAKVAGAARVAGSPEAAGGAGNQVRSVGQVVERLIGNSAGQSGYRTLVVGAGDDSDVREVAADVAAGLASMGRQVVLVDWSLDGIGISRGLGLAPAPGFTELVTGNASFEDVIKSMPDSDFHVIPCGSPQVQGSSAIDPDRLNLLLDALDEAYADVIISGSASASRALFRTIEGRIDAGVLVGAADDQEGPSKLLGFEVTDIDVIRLELGGAPAMVVGKRSRPVGRASGSHAASSPV